MPRRYAGSNEGEKRSYSPIPPVGADHLLREMTPPSKNVLVLRDETEQSSQTTFRISFVNKRRQQIPDLSSRCQSEGQPTAKPLPLTTRRQPLKVPSLPSTYRFRVHPQLRLQLLHGETKWPLLPDGNHHQNHHPPINAPTVEQHRLRQHPAPAALSAATQTETDQQRFRKICRSTPRLPGIIGLVKRTPAARTPAGASFLRKFLVNILENPIGTDKTDRFEQQQNIVGLPSCSPVSKYSGDQLTFP